MTQKDARCSSVIWPKMTFWSTCPQSLWMLSHWYLCSLQFTLIRCTLSYKTFTRLVIASLHLRVRHPDFSLTFPVRLTCRLNSQSPCSYKVGCVVSVWKEVLLRGTSALNSDWLSGHGCPSELGQPWSSCLGSVEPCLGSVEPCLGSVEPCGKARGSRGPHTGAHSVLELNLTSRCRPLPLPLWASVSFPVECWDNGSSMLGFGVGYLRCVLNAWGSA